MEECIADGVLDSLEELCTVVGHPIHLKHAWRVAVQRYRAGNTPARVAV